MSPILTKLGFKETCTIGSSTFTLSLWGHPVSRWPADNHDYFLFLASPSMRTRLRRFTNRFLQPGSHFYER
jgi:hypothetical protein